ncbi:threonine/serine exporter family protein [Wukongibacter baidiensis]|uniref:threonine/serine exporter family protein n=1 Tax=Wukongibacter baidiensis TaxID=1723361 RepID=UPI003D7F7E4B
MTENEKKAILRIALYAGEIMLKNGAETYRTEDTINIICKSKELKHVNSFVTPTGIFVSDDRLDGISFIKRIKARTIDLSKISKVNNFAREFVKVDMTPKEALLELKRIDNEGKYKNFARVIFTGIASAFFALLFGAGLTDFILAFFISMIAIIVNWEIEKFGSTGFLANATSGALIAFFALISKSIGWGNSIDMIIVGSIMPLVPGVALTNGLRDFISGDLIAGATRVAEAILIAVSIAVGVGTVLKLWMHLFGGVL